MAIPRQPVRRLELEVLEDFFFGVRLVADQIDLADSRALAFFDVDLHAHTVIRQLFDFGRDTHGVFATAEILIGEVLLDVLEHRTIEGLARGKTHVAQTLGQILGLDVLVTLELEALDRRTLEHSHDQRALFKA